MIAGGYRGTIAPVQLEVVQGDITREQVDAIVNAANESLLGGGGVDGAIHRAGGPCDPRGVPQALGGCATGDVKATGGGNLGRELRPPRGRSRLARRDDGEAGLLASCHRRSLALATGARLRSVAFPAISTGVYGYPVDRAAIVALATIREHARPPVELVRVVCFSEPSLQAFEAARADLGIP